MEGKEGFCHAIREEGLLVSLLDGELQTAQENRILTHLRMCPECLGVVADLLSVDNRLQALFQRKPQRREVEEKKYAKRFMIEVDKLPVGQTLDIDLVDDEDRLLIAAGTVLTASLLESVKQRGIQKLAIRTVDTVKTEPEPQVEIPAIGISEIESYIAEAEIEPAVSSFVRDKCKSAVIECFKNLEESGTITYTEVEESAMTIAGEILSKPSLALALTDLLMVDSGLHAHSVNVLILFLIVARAMGYPAQFIKDHAPAVLLHDIGRIVFRRINASSGIKRSQEEEDREHTESGYAYLWNLGGINQSALKMVINHHERFDGKGYPRGLKGTMLSDWDQLLIFSNTYDNLTWNRETGVRSGFHDALTTLIREGSKYVRKGIITTAIQTFGYYPPGSWVKLNNGEIGIVSKAHPGSPLKPFVTVIYSEDGKKLGKPKFVNLASNQNAYIKSPVSIQITP